MCKQIRFHESRCSPSQQSIILEIFLAMNATGNDDLQAGIEEKF